MGIAIKYDKSGFVERAIIKHGNKYDYSLSDYINNKDKIIIICPYHGEFYQKPNNHLQGKGCHHCSRNQKMKIDDFIERSNIIHKNKYNYIDKNYINTLTPIKIECKDHGIFEQSPATHLKGVGCPKCAGNKRLTNDEFIEKANIKHNNLYDYPNLNYKNYDTKIEIDCKSHGLFIQSPRDHLSGRGCPKCRKSKGEIKISEILNSKNIKFNTEYKFNDLKYKYLLKFDFVIFDKESIKYIIEYNGEQHYVFKKWMHKNYENFKISQKRDTLKLEYCKNNNYKLYTIRYDDDIENEIMKIIESKT